jgi:hypothetical protein
VAIAYYIDVDVKRRQEAEEGAQKSGEKPSDMDVDVVPNILLSPVATAGGNRLVTPPPAISSNGPIGDK